MAPQTEYIRSQLLWTNALVGMMTMVLGRQTDGWLEINDLQNIGRGARQHHGDDGVGSFPQIVVDVVVGDELFV